MCVYQNLFLRVFFSLPQTFNKPQTVSTKYMAAIPCRHLRHAPAISLFWHHRRCTSPTKQLSKSFNYFFTKLLYYFYLKKTFYADDPAAQTPLITQAMLEDAKATMRDEMADMLLELKKTVSENSEAAAQNFTKIQKQFGAAADSVDVATEAVCVRIH